MKFRTNLEGNSNESNTWVNMFTNLSWNMAWDTVLEEWYFPRRDAFDEFRERFYHHERISRYSSHLRWRPSSKVFRAQMRSRRHKSFWEVFSTSDCFVSTPRLVAQYTFTTAALSIVRPTLHGVGEATWKGTDEVIAWNEETYSELRSRRSPTSS